MNFCIFCGNKLMGNEVFCPKCGKRLDNIHIEVPVKKLIQDELKDIKKSSLNEEKEFVNEKNTLKDKTKNHIVKEIQNITRDSLIEDKEMSVLTDEREIVENPQNIAIKRDNFETKNHIVEEKQSIAKDNSVKNNDISVLSDKQEKVEKLQNTTIEEKKDEFKDYIVKKGQNTVESTLNKKGSIQTSRDDKVSPFSNIKNDKPKNIDKVDNLMMDSSIKKSSDTGRLSTNTRIYLGKRLTGNKKIYWEYGNPQLPNKHMLVTGKSGQGKTYFLQTIMWELSKNKVSSLVIDYTDSYLNNELDDDFKKKMGKKLKEVIVYQEKLPINPFKIQKRFLPGLVLTETPEDMVDRIIEVLDFIFHLGIQQKSLARRIMLKGYKNNPTDYTLTQFKEQLLETNSGENVYSRMSVLLDRDPFTYQSSFDWSKVFNYEGTVTILQMVQYQRQIQNTMIEFLLWDLFYHSQTKKDGTIYPIFLDEIQNLNFSSSSPTVKILREGRKFGWSGIFATQAMSSIKGEVDALCNAAEQIHFLPPEDQVSSLAGYIAPNAKEKNIFEARLTRLKKGQCIMSGPILDTDLDTKNLINTNKMISIDSFENR
ncbi:helicase HerA domain-containing protein [Ligilactobacillus salivarius]|uniref:helicase HerA domain-containing protein n=1 Tax=Ligilactobacillus salivarius TaxID=1624 RepID=UPI0022DEA1F2|nr:DUF87 domain-containing protein [Ligilactobacillus salivarius]